MNRRERVSLSIPCFGIRFSAVLYITNAPSIQMIHQLLGTHRTTESNTLQGYIISAIDSERAY